MKERYDKVQLVIKNGRREELREIAKSKGLSINAYIKQVIEQDCGLEL